MTTDSSNATLLLKFKKHRDEAADHLKKALDLDESSNGSQSALQSYQRAIQSFQSALAVKFDSANDYDEHIQRAERHREKLLTNLQLAQKRVTELKTNVEHKPTAGSTQQPKTISQPRVTPQPRKPNTSAPLKQNPINPNNLKNVDSKLAGKILDELMEKSHNTLTFDDIVGQDVSKAALDECILLPLENPALFTGIRVPPRAVLMFGPPGTGKTMMARAVSSMANTRFFNISAASLVSKWVGDSEKTVRALFAIAREVAPSVVFIDEIDSILCARKEDDNEAGRRLKTQFLLEFDGIGSKTSNDDDPTKVVVLLAATNRPWDLDDAVIRRFGRRVYVPLPDYESRRKHFEMTFRREPTLKQSAGELLRADTLDRLAQLSDGYSPSDLENTIKYASMGPIRELPREVRATLKPSELRPVNLDDFVAALQATKPSVDPTTLARYVEWNNEHGGEE